MFVSASDLPWQQRFGAIYDTGATPELLKHAVKAYIERNHQPFLPTLLQTSVYNGLVYRFLDPVFHVAFGNGQSQYTTSYFNEEGDLVGYLDGHLQNSRPSYP